jgi:hypothetical protein
VPAYAMKKRPELHLPSKANYIAQISNQIIKLISRWTTVQCAYTDDEHYKHLKMENDRIKEKVTLHIL